jgi:glycerophosphoryl diester phosphodiesterase
MMILLKKIAAACIAGTVAAALLWPSSSSAQTMHDKHFDWQGHRGARGLLPENSIPAFLKALGFPAITTLELDLAVSKDGILIVSHEPWMSSDICSQPDGSPVPAAQARKTRLLELTYDQIRQYDCGSRGNSRFPQQQPLPCHKPSLEEMVQAVQSFCRENQRELPRFNIEIKSHPEGDGGFTPPVADFSALVVAEIKRLGIRELACVQSFDLRALQAVHQLDPTLPTALLIEKPGKPLEHVERLGYTPAVYSPHYKLLRKKDLRALHERGVKVIPWTVNDLGSMQKLVKWGVDGIITDYPNLAW